MASKVLRRFQLRLFSNGIEPNQRMMKNEPQKSRKPTIEKLAACLNDDETFSGRLTPAKFDKAARWMQGFLEKFILRRPIVWGFSNEKGFDAFLVIRCPQRDHGIKDGFVKRIVIPSGFKKEDLKASVHGRTITLRVGQHFTNKFDLPHACANCTSSKIKIMMPHDCLVQVFVPKSEDKGSQDLPIE